MNWLKMNNKCDQETGLRGNDDGDNNGNKKYRSFWEISELRKFLTYEVVSK
jgi:hypothetical protein